MKKIVALLLSLFILAGCSNSNQTTTEPEVSEPVTIEVSQVMSDLSAEDAKDVDLYVASGKGTTAPFAVPEESVETFAETLQSVNNILADVEYADIEKADITETNIVFQLKKGNANLYVYNDGNIKVIYDLESDFYSVGTKTTDELAAALNSFTTALSAE